MSGAVTIKFLSSIYRHARMYVCAVDVRVSYSVICCFLVRLCAQLGRIRIRKSFRHFLHDRLVSLNAWKRVLVKCKFYWISCLAFLPLCGCLSFARSSSIGITVSPREHDRSHTQTCSRVTGPFQNLGISFTRTHYPRHYIFIPKYIGRVFHARSRVNMSSREKWASIFINKEQRNVESRRRRLNYAVILS